MYKLALFSVCLAPLLVPIVVSSKLPLGKAAVRAVLIFGALTLAYVVGVVVVAPKLLGM